MDTENPDPALAGRVLLGELQCLRCHQATPTASQWVDTKEAPKLDSVGSRIRPEWILGYLENPQGAKSGATMPDLLSHLPPGEKKEVATALTHYLATLGTPLERRMDGKLIKTGRTLYQQVGCAACHGPRDAAAKLEKDIPNMVSLGNLDDKYRYGSLAQFLANPHEVRASGRMPALLNPKEAEAVAAYLLQNSPHEKGPGSPTVSYQCYEGDWDKLPDFSKLQPVRKGKASGLDLSVAPRENNVAVVFTGVWDVKKAGNYRFFLASDDGSSLKIDGKVVVLNDGIHPNQMREGRTRLEAGLRKVEIAVFQGGGEFELSAEVQGPEMARTDLGFLLRPEGETEPAKSDATRFSPRPELATKGKALFSQLGCAQCHALTGEPAKPTAKEIAKLPAEGGCLGTPTGKAHPVYGLSKDQAQWIGKALEGLKSPNQGPDAAQKSTQKLVALNCIGCHQRGDLGGVEAARNPLFLGTQPEMGDEARIPPHITLVGAKLQKNWLREVLEKGTKVRPYMLTRMPRYGNRQIESLVEDLPKVDALAAVPVPKFSESEGKVKSAAKFLVGGKAFGCVKCHTFNGIKAEGVQGLDMVNMANRLNRDWFITYMKNPSAMRPGTRMPASWPNGKTFFENLLGGDVPQQMEAVWYYLTLRDKAPIPEGLVRGAMPLVPEKGAIIYRNFIEGAGPRAIAVGYPEKANLAFDANLGRLALIWQGPFIDASKHWLDRGVGFQGPLGENVVAFTAVPGVAILGASGDPWPEKPTQYRFLGYKTTPDDRPTFLYRVGESQIEDFTNAKTDGENPSLVRTVAVDKPTKGLTLFLARSESLTGEGSTFKLGKDLTIKIQGAQGQLRDRGGRKELVVPLDSLSPERPLTIEYHW